MSSWKIIFAAFLLFYSSDGLKVRRGENRRRRDEPSPGEILSEKLSTTFQKKMAALDPLHLEQIPLNWEHGGCSVRGFIEETNITGLSDSQIHLENFDTENFGLSVLVQISNLEGRGVLGLDSNICGFGQLTNKDGAAFLMALNNITARIIANFTAVGHQVLVDYLDMSVNVTGAEFEAPHLFLHPAVNELVSKVVASYGSQIFNLVKPLMKECVQKRFREKMNEFLATADLFGSSGDNPSPAAKK